jgi:hypothetical protein
MAMSAVGLSLIVAAVWCNRAQKPPVQETAVQSIVAARITKHDALGMPSAEPLAVRDPPHVRALVEALGIDEHPVVPCPPDYASAELGLLLTGRDVYARRNVYVWDLHADASAGARVVTVSSAGCRGGPPANASVLRREIESAVVVKRPR